MLSPGHSPARQLSTEKVHSTQVDVSRENRPPQNEICLPSGTPAATKCSDAYFHTDQPPSQSIYRGENLSAAKNSSETCAPSVDTDVVTTLSDEQIRAVQTKCGNNTRTSY